MTNVGDEVSLSRLELIVLARLSSTRPPKPSELGAAVALALPAESPARARAIAADVLARLSARALVSGRAPRSAAARRGAAPSRARPATEPGRALTERGRQALCAQLGLAQAPSWNEVRDVHLPALALGLRPGSAAADKAVRDADTIAAAVLGSEFAVAGAETPTALADALIAQLLGIAAGPMTLSRIRAHVLARRAELDGTSDAVSDANPGAGPAANAEPKLAVKLAAAGEPGPTARRLAARRLRVPRADKRSMLPALARRWASAAQGAADPLPAPPQPQLPLSFATAPPAPARPAEHRRATEAPGAAARPAAAPASAQSGRDDVDRGVKKTAHVNLAASLSPDALLAMVREALPAIGADGRFGPEKVFISAIWHRLAREGRGLDLSLERFKQWLVIANRDRLLDLVRADLVGAMDPRLVAESEIDDLGSTFHFVLDRRAVTSEAERRSHAR